MGRQGPEHIALRPHTDGGRGRVSVYGEADWSRLLLIRLIIGSKRLDVRFTFDNRKGLIGRTRLLHMRWGEDKSRQGERETRLAADAKALPILICRN